MKYNPKEYATLSEIDFLNELDLLLAKGEMSQEAYSSLKSRFYEILKENKSEVIHEESREPYNI